MATVIEEFDSVSIKNSSIQFFEDGVQQPGTKFGCVGQIEGETELIEMVKKCAGTEVKKKSKPTKMNLTVSAHIPVKVMRDFFGLTNNDLKPGIWKYSGEAKGKKFVYTADVIDDFEDITKLIAFPNCVSATGLKFTIENAADELAMLELEFTALADTENNFYYEAMVSELDDPTVATQWHTQFTPELVKAVPAP